MLWHAALHCIGVTGLRWELDLTSKFRPPSSTFYDDGVSFFLRRSLHHAGFRSPGLLEILVKLEASRMPFA